MGALYRIVDWDSYYENNRTRELKTLQWVPQWVIIIFVISPLIGLIVWLFVRKTAKVDVALCAQHDARRRVMAMVGIAARQRDDARVLRYSQRYIDLKGPNDAVRVILTTGRGSASLLQRNLEIGYSRASRLIDQMTEYGILGPFKGSKARELLTTLEEWEQAQADHGACA